MALAPRITLPDDLYDRYETEAIETGHPIERILEYRLRHGLDVSPAGRFLVVANGALEALEKKLGGGNLLSAGDLVKKVDRLAKIEFGHHEIPLTIGQMEEIAWRARKQGKTVGEVIAGMWARISTEFFRFVS